MKAAVLTLIAFCFAVGLAASGEAATTGAYTNASRVMLNPQPLPPGGKVMATTRFAAPGGKVMLNPQPLPPGGKVMATTRFAAPGGKVMLNPQPLPPRTR